MLCSLPSYDITLYITGYICLSKGYIEAFGNILHNYTLHIETDD